jgi:hypothetical protein
MKFFDKPIGIDEAMELVKLNPSNFSNLSSSMKSDVEQLMKMVSVSPMILPEIIRYFKTQSGKTCLHVDDLIKVLEHGVQTNPSAFVLIKSPFVTASMCNIMVEKMKKDKKYLASWITHIPVNFRDFKFMEEAVTARPNLLSNDDPYWSSADGEKLRKKQGFKKRQNSIRRILSFGSLSLKTEE